MEIWFENERFCERSFVNLEEYVWNAMVHAHGTQVEGETLCVWKTGS